jgi:trehalose-6-phosphate synthase
LCFTGKRLGCADAFLQKSYYNLTMPTYALRSNAVLYPPTHPFLKKCMQIMPTGVKPERLLSVWSEPDTAWRRGELAAQFRGKTVLIGVDDMDVFKGIELKLAAFEQVLEQHPEWRGKLVLVQVTSAPRAPGRDVEELHSFCQSIVERINARYRCVFVG